MANAWTKKIKETSMVAITDALTDNDHEIAGRGYFQMAMLGRTGGDISIEEGLNYGIEALRYAILSGDGYLFSASVQCLQLYGCDYAAAFRVSGRKFKCPERARDRPRLTG